MIIDWHRPDHPDVIRLAAAQQAELRILAPHPDDVVYPLHDDIDFAVGMIDGVPVACGALQRLGRREAEIKRMYVVPDHRRAGLARLIIGAIEDRAISEGFATLRLETGVTYDQAIRLYTGAGYRRTHTYGEYIGNPSSACFAKRLPAAAALTAATAAST